jgi:hypothetical protein
MRLFGGTWSARIWAKSSAFSPTRAETMSVGGRDPALHATRRRCHELELRDGRGMTSEAIELALATCPCGQVLGIRARGRHRSGAGGFVAGLAGEGGEQAVAAGGDLVVEEVAAGLGALEVALEQLAALGELAGLGEQDLADRHVG